MRNNIGWLVAVGLLLFNPARAEVNINITPWDLFAAASVIGIGNSSYTVDGKGDVDRAINIANKLCKSRPRG